VRGHRIARHFQARRCVPKPRPARESPQIEKASLFFVKNHPCDFVISPLDKPRGAPTMRGMPTKKSTPAKKRKPNAALMKPVQPDALLSVVVGAKPIPRGELTKKLWDYIKKNKLQDAKKRTQINADDALKAIFGGKKSVSMFEMTKLVSGHIKA
jgi:upstream activation factor subunit UAF30